MSSNVGAVSSRSGIGSAAATDNTDCYSPVVTVITVILTADDTAMYTYMSAESRCTVWVKVRSVVVATGHEAATT